MKTKFEQLGAERFFKLAPIICWISDAVILFYLINYQLERYITPKLMQLIYKMQTGGMRLSIYDATDFATVMKNQFAFTFTVFLAFHTLVYIFAFLKKQKAMKYVKNYTMFGAILTTLEVILVFISSFKISFFTFISLMGYLFVYLGYKKFIQKLAK